MWSRYHWLAARIRVRTKEGRGVCLPPFFLSISAARSAILSADGLLGLIPGSPGRAARGGQDVLQKALAILQDEGLNVDVKVNGRNEKVRILVKMV